MDLSEIGRIASEARQDFELGRAYTQRLGDIYSEYSGVLADHVYGFMEMAKLSFPSWNCGLATAYMKDKLQSGEIIRGKYNGSDHTFLLLDNGMIVDVTADQFGGPAVYVGPLKKPWSDSKHENQYRLLE